VTGQMSLRQLEFQQSDSLLILQENH
jgi:hypothetical protein